MTSVESQPVHHILRQRIIPRLAELALCRNSADLGTHPLYRTLEPDLHYVLNTPEVGGGAPTAPARLGYRFVAWNIERGAQLAGQLEILRTHPYLREADVLLLTETDIGMVRSGNRHVPRELAEALGMHYAFVPCYLNLTKGSGLEQDLPGSNELGLHGNAILSRYPLTRVHPIFLSNGVDIFASREKRLGRQAALAADIVFPDLTVTAVCVHLDAHSTQRHRFYQMFDILEALGARQPVVLGGDWNTTTYNSSRAIHSILGFWLRVFMGVDNVIRNHYLHPYRWFEKDLFRLLEERGFDYRAANRLGEHTVAYDITDLRSTQALQDWVPAWCFHFIRWALRHHGGRCPVKLDWFATRGLHAKEPTVIHEVREGRSVPLSDHDAIGVDVAPMDPNQPATVNR